MLRIYGVLFHFHYGFIHICDTTFGKFSGAPDSRDFGFVHWGLENGSLRVDLMTNWYTSKYATLMALQTGDAK